MGESRLKMSTLLAALFGPVARTWRARGQSLGARMSVHRLYTRKHTPKAARKARRRMANASRRRNRHARSA